MYCLNNLANGVSRCALEELWAELLLLSAEETYAEMWRTFWGGASGIREYIRSLEQSDLAGGQPSSATIVNQLISLRGVLGLCYNALWENQGTDYTAAASVCVWGGAPLMKTYLWFGFCQFVCLKGTTVHLLDYLNEL